LLAEIPRIQRTATSLAILDVLVSFAEAAVRNDYSKPKVHDGDAVEIRRGRHPVIELSLDGRSFVPNDVYIDGAERSLLLITGPNMAGKSTYMRMTALIVIMAQAGCFVPAEWASIGVCDRLYTRIGASDNLARGESTFYVEMSELAYILNTATPASLVILDEIGRGTSTYDGLAIAWAVCEKLCAGSSRIRTLFATHYHELSMLEGNLEGIHNLNTLISETPEGIVFLHQIAEGSADHSYGIHVAQLAGVPQDLIENARVKLDMLEAGRSDVTGTRLTVIPGVVPESNPLTVIAAPEPQSSAGQQLSLFGNIPANVTQTLRNLDLLNITPMQAFAILEELKAEVED
jgi:DNA mismatch repair protein MutS